MVTILVGGNGLVNMFRVEQLINDYVNCWIPKRPTYSGEWEDNDFGCEHLQIIRNGFNLEDFDHDELSKLATLLTRALRGQINRDHKFFWSWCAFLTIHFEKSISLFGDRAWSLSIRDLINLLLSVQRHFPAGPVYIVYLNQALKYVNSHLLETWGNKYQIAGPLTFSVLEGLLRRKNKDYVNLDGSVKKSFRVSNPKRKKGIKSFNPNDHNKWLNRINDSIRCFEELVTLDRGRGCPYLKQMKTEIASLYPSGLDIYDMIDTWRNDLIHGKEYWQNRVPILVNLICLLIIDEIEPSSYNSQKEDMRRIIEWNSKSWKISGIRPPWDLYPPDI